jgi:hypothetical protein
MFIPELAVGLCRIFLDTLQKYLAVDMSSRPLTYIVAMISQNLCRLNSIEIYLCSSMFPTLRTLSNRK